MLKRTPLFEAHQKLGARLVEFGGWEMPVQYSSIMDEHLAVRRAAGLFDISHMGEVRVEGTRALEFLNYILTNDLRKISVGQGQYTLMCNDRGGAIDDLYVYWLRERMFLLVINASRIEQDVAWMKKQLEAFSQRDDVLLEDISGQWGALALQGPRAGEIIDRCSLKFSPKKIAASRPSELKKNQVDIFQFGTREIYVARTGYTGEDGFEIVAAAELIEPVWKEILAVGHAFCLQPAGLGARDTLRTEVCYPLYGHELDEQTTPIEAGLAFFVALDKPDFIGRSVLAEQKAKGVSKKCVAFKMTDKSAPPRPQYPIWSSGPAPAKIGQVVSGTQSPSLGIGIGMGYVPPDAAKAGTSIEIEIRGKRAAAQVVPKPIYRKPS
jgi:aminomethyltransferase